MNDEWTYAQSDPGEELARLHHFSIKKKQEDGDVEFLITVKEFVTERRDQSMRFLAQTDKQTNQRTAPFAPSGWGNTLLKALSECIGAIRRFPYEP